MSLVSISRKLSAAVDTLTFGPPVTHVYNPLAYARRPHEVYLRRFGTGTKEVLFVGMNPGPFGMAQTGVPFGDVTLVRDWMGISERVDRPDPEHPKRPITGFDCRRSEVSGSRLWGWARERFGTAELFFERFFVANYCPLIFIEPPTKNRIPEKLQPNERKALFDVCDHALRETVTELQPSLVIGVGAFAEKRARVALAGSANPTEGSAQSTADPIRIGSILHPSPASPLANRGWAQEVERQLAALGVKLP